MQQISVSSLYFGLTLFALPLLGISDEEKVLKIADIWSKKKVKSVLLKEKPEDCNFGRSSFKYDILFACDEKIDNDWGRPGVRIKRSKDEKTFLVRDCFKSSNLVVVGSYNLAKCNDHFAIIPVVSDEYNNKSSEYNKHVHLYLFEIFQKKGFCKNDAIFLDFVKDLGEFPYPRQSFITYDSSKIYVHCTDESMEKNYLHLVSVELPEGLIIEKKKRKINYDA